MSMLPPRSSPPRNITYSAEFYARTLRTIFCASLQLRLFGFCSETVTLVVINILANAVYNYDSLRHRAITDLAGAMDTCITDVSSTVIVTVKPARSQAKVVAAVNDSSCLPITTTNQYPKHLAKSTHLTDSPSVDSFLPITSKSELK